MTAHDINKLIMADLFYVLLHDLVQVFKNFSSTQAFHNTLNGLSRRPPKVRMRGA